MKITINESKFLDQFRLQGRSDEFSTNALRALFNYLEEVYGEDGECEYVLDVISLCCHFTEYENALEAAKIYSGFFTSEEDLSEGEQERQALEFLSKRTTIIHFVGGIIMQEF